jgi:hypothetical protein
MWWLLHISHISSTWIREGGLLFCTVSCCPVTSATFSPTVFNTLSAVWSIFEVVVGPAALVDTELFEATCSLSVML